MHSRCVGFIIYANENELNLNILISAESALRNDFLLMVHSLLLR